MIGYETEEQQVQAIKQFWKDNGIAIILGALIGIGGLWGWRAYTEATITAKEEASSEFQETVQSVVESKDTAKLASFLEAKSDTGYGPLAAMILANQAAEQEDYAGAKEALLKVLDADPVIADVVSLRLADLHLQLDEFDDALAVLSKVSSSAFEAQAEELKGDALLAKSDFDAAKVAYTQALALAPNDTNVKMKRDNIAFAKTRANQIEALPVTEPSVVQPTATQAEDAAEQVNESVDGE
ncbi:YfgM family protein [Glaciecola petra]|uniref:Ancillary SecYEG translocon subunit n=1 Tax=Glaciecola petra TaxID=3075602 RepID=A0ABU2ZTY3_9ALTE|nr:tetratricopeptide repeat protein [Aestuariibacter sp. P117]MDT0595865.1 tetratricopeptide repeat protein [Aestuariibacter sp. P117]